ncbi:MAG: hypothetical protein F7B11_02175 [Caldisphaeraceae archaeon]|nr:hypothetical protein [Caldisphaeraceae archaeon]MEB2793203.1 hypothetical protein [Caldisphaeraceae archaeon]MEB3691409.1 hypothetical protein [Caldisphaeraceae archaeon]MEB3797642.1 hypothetical protein [Caldisphaeraceae archaeon]
MVYLNLNAILDVVSAIIGFSVSYVSFKYNRLIQETVLNYISMGFALLGIGLLMQGVLMLLFAFNLFKFPDDYRLSYTSSVFYLVLQLISYAIIAIGYSKETYWPKESLALPLAYVLFKKKQYFLLRTLIFDASQLIIIFFLAFIVFLGFLVHSRDKKTFSLLVLISFSLMLISHIGFLFSSLAFSEYYYVISNTVQFVGFLMLLIFLVRSGHIG